jgi:hypothetical protein
VHNLSHPLAPDRRGRPDGHAERLVQEDVEPELQAKEDWEMKG